MFPLGQHAIAAEWPRSVSKAITVDHPEFNPPLATRLRVFRFLLFPALAVSELASTAALT